MKEILLALIHEVESLKANQAVIAKYVPTPPTMAQAHEAKHLALKDSAEFFDKLRKQIEALP